MATETDSAIEEDVTNPEDEEVDEPAQDETESDKVETDTDDSDKGETDSEPEEEPEFERRFTQFKGSTPEEYIKNLESGYDNSSKEALKLLQENKTLKETVDRVNGVIAQNPDLAERIQGGAPEAPATPAMQWAESQMKTTWDKEQAEFLTAHPEVQADPLLAEQLNNKLETVVKVVQADEKRLVGMREGLDIAWKLLGRDDSNEEVRMAARDSASQGKASGGKKPAESKPKFTEAQIELHMDMMNLPRDEAIKSLSEYN